LCVGIAAQNIQYAGLALRRCAQLRRRGASSGDQRFVIGKMKRLEELHVISCKA
jgi:hypothetical protein